MQAGLRRSGQPALLVVLLLLTLLIVACRTAPEPEAAPEATLLPPTEIVASPTPLPASPTPVPTPLPTATPVTGASTIGDPVAPELGNSGYDVLTYTLDLVIDPATQYVDGTTTIAAESTLEDLGRLSLDFVGFDISALTVDGTATSYRREGRKLVVDLPEPQPVGTEFAIEVQYSGTPLVEDSPYVRFPESLGLTFLENNTFYVLSQPDGARYWFPNNDHPLDKAVYRINLTVPLGLAAIANGELLGTEVTTMPDGTQGATFFWAHDYPMASYVALAAAGHYTRVDDVSPGGIPLTYYYFPEFEEEYLEATEITPEAVDWMADLFGPYPFETYGQATYYAMGISMESQTMTLLSYQMLNERTVIHELAHAWFGNWVTPSSWADVWRNEGFSTYVELLWLDYKEPGALERELAAIEAEAAERGIDYPLDEPLPDGLLIWDVYNRGALMVHALRLEMGDEAFFSGLRTYFERYGGGNASQAELQAVLEEAAGKSLDTFFAEWLE